MRAKKKHVKCTETSPKAQQERCRRNTESATLLLDLVKGKERDSSIHARGPEQPAAHAVGSNRAPAWEVAPPGSNRMNFRSWLNFHFLCVPISRVPRSLHTPLPTQAVESACAHSHSSRAVGVVGTTRGARLVEVPSHYFLRPPSKSNWLVVPTETEGGSVAFSPIAIFSRVPTCAAEQ